MFYDATNVTVGATIIIFITGWRKEYKVSASRDRRFVQYGVLVGLVRSGDLTYQFSKVGRPPFR